MRYLVRSSVLSTRLATILKAVPPPAEVRFTIRGHREDLVLRAGTPGGVLARRSRQRRGEYVDWAASSFRRVDPERALEEVADRVIRVEVPGVAGPFTDLAAFLRWVEAQDAVDPRHSYLIKLPTTLFEALRVKAKEEHTTVRDVIVQILRRAL